MESHLIHGECLEEMANLPASSVDMVLCDLPYGTTRNRWDSRIDLGQLWQQYNRVCKPSAAIVLTAAQPFTSILVASNLSAFKYAWIWEKDRATGHLNANKQPLRAHEDIVVFYRQQALYNPQMGSGKPYSNSHRPGDAGECYGEVGHSAVTGRMTRYPRTVLRFDVEPKPVHPTQKPVALMEYMIRTYTHAGMTVLDCCMGSGTTGVACANTGRNFIGIEQDLAYFEIARERIDGASAEWAMAA